MRIETILTPAEISGLPRRDLCAATCVVFDVLRATSTLLAALANGARRVHPVVTIEEARALRRAKYPDALLGGERDGVRIEGFDLGNSPREYTAEAVAGRDIISTTTNGTVALRACAGAREVMAGAWVNLDVLAFWLRQRLAVLEHLVLICAGTGEEFALEDGLAAGGLISRLTTQANAMGPVKMDDAGLALVSMYEVMGREPLSAMRLSANGRRLEEIGLGADVQWCAATSRLPWVAVLRDGALEGKFIEVPS